MASLHWSHSHRVVRPLSLLSSTRAQLRSTRYNRVSPYLHGHQQGVRSFHIGPMALAAVQATQDMIINIHSITNIPWFLIIPGLAIGINVIFRQPFTAYAHRIQQRRREFDVVLRGWNMRHRNDIMREGLPPEQHGKEALSRFKKTQSRIYNKMGLQNWRLFLNILGFPFWVLGIDSVRRICGGPRGIVGSILTGVTDDAPLGSSTPESVEIVTPPTDVATTSASQASVFDANTASAMTEHVRHLPDPSIAVEGCLWFPDLSVADPFHVLPLALSLVLFLNMLPKTRAGKRQLFGLDSRELSTMESQTQLRLRRMLICATFLIGPVTMDMPAALHLYWVTSTITHAISTKVLLYLMPMKVKLVELCKNPDSKFILPKRSKETIPQTKQRKAKR
ncbi:hypothetical protein F5Y04DRAFT_218440 [Hypomontagnella monticulosa]|nr:hypothetical protein F5Y04DRAFT_218440 [Hypomontagnella monticulosa]